MSMKTVYIVLFLFLINICFCEDNLTISDTPAPEEKTETPQPSDPSPQQETTPQSDASDEDSKKETEEYSRRIMEEMQLNKKTSLTKAEFKEFLTRLITRDEKYEPMEIELYTELVNRIVKKVPDVIPSTEINKYADTDVFMKELSSLIRDRYGEDALKDIQGLENSKTDL